MNVIKYSTAYANLAKMREQVCNDHAPVIIIRKREAPVMMISLEDYQAMVETAYLLGLPVNARHLLESIAELEAGEGTAQELIELTKLPPTESRWVSAAWMQTTKVVYPHQAKRA